MVSVSVICFFWPQLRHVWGWPWFLSLSFVSFGLSYVTGEVGHGFCLCHLFLLASVTSRVGLAMVSVSVICFLPLLFPHFYLTMLSVNISQFLPSVALFSSLLPLFPSLS